MRKNMGIFRKIFKSYSEKEVKRVMPIVEQINGLEEEISKLTDEQLKNKTNEFKKQLEIWLNTSSNEDKIQFSNWHFLDKYIFNL